MTNKIDWTLVIRIWSFVFAVALPHGGLGRPRPRLSAVRTSLLRVQLVWRPPLPAVPGRPPRRLAQQDRRVVTAQDQLLSSRVHLAGRILPPSRTASARWCVSRRANVPVGETSWQTMPRVRGGIPPWAIANRPTASAVRSLDHAVG